MLPQVRYLGLLVVLLIRHAQQFCSRDETVDIVVEHFRRVVRQVLGELHDLVLVFLLLIVVISQPIEESEIRRILLVFENVVAWITLDTPVIHD